MCLKSCCVDHRKKIYIAADTWADISIGVSGAPVKVLTPLSNEPSYATNNIYEALFKVLGVVVLENVSIETCLSLDIKFFLSILMAKLGTIR